MKRGVVLALLALITGCGGATHLSVRPSVTPSPSIQPTDTATVDAAVTRMAHAGHLLSHISGSLASEEGQYQLAESDARLASQQLTPAPSGVPDALARDAAAKFQAVSDGLAALLTCLESEESCTSVASDVDQKAETAGEVTAELLPYSTLTAGEVQAMLK